MNLSPEVASPRKDAGGVSRLWSDPVVGPLARELYRRCGLVFEGGQAHLFRKRVERRASDAGQVGVGEYVEALCARPDEREFERLIELLTVNETYFFREEEHFALLLETFWPEWQRHSPRTPVRIWSAACSTGCEPYTLGMLLREGRGRGDVEILGTDVNARVLGEAKEGNFGEFALRNTSEYYRGKYFQRQSGGFRLAPAVREMVRFQQLNLLRAEGRVPLGQFHAIFCRNVLIYFDLAAKRRVIRALSQALRPGGVLLVGRSESLFNVPEAPPMGNAGGILYHRKPW